MIYNIRLYHTANPINVYTKMVSPSSNTSRIATTEMRSNFTVTKEQKHGEYNDPFFDRIIENATDGLQSDCYKLIYKIPHDNALTIANYILSMKSEMNPADNYRRYNIRLLATSYPISYFFSVLVWFYEDLKCINGIFFSLF